MFLACLRSILRTSLVLYQVVDPPLGRPSGLSLDSFGKTDYRGVFLKVAHQSASNPKFK